MPDASEGARIVPAETSVRRPEARDSPIVDEPSVRGEGALGPEDERGPGAGASSADPYGLLSPRERRILALIADGLTNREIGERLGITEKTVKNHVTGLLAKLRLRHRTEAALFAVRRDIQEERGDRG
jgi:DNA-binding NarL/FixJ family response regulator